MLTAAALVTLTPPKGNNPNSHQLVSRQTSRLNLYSEILFGHKK